MVAGVFTSYEIANDVAFRKALTDAVAEVGDLRIALTLIARDWRQSNRAQFSLLGAGQYPELSPAYARRKQRQYGNLPILVRSGRLRDSLTGRPNADSIQIITQTSLTMGTLVPYGIYHQSDVEPRPVIPQRKFLFIGPEAPTTAPSAVTGRLERWTSILDAEIQRKLNRIST